MDNHLEDRYIRFDWAIKRLLRQKANFGVLEGFLTVFLGEKVTILEILESESNQQSIDDKFNRVDIKARNSKDEIIIIEIQNTRELYYLERILYGVAKAITEHISLGETYYHVKKIYSISILYFDIGRAYLEICHIGLYSAYDCRCRIGLSEEIFVRRGYYSLVYCSSDSVESHSDELLLHVCDPVLYNSLFC